jgi:DNA-binding CsgD family transcriptional regulator
LKDAEKQKIIHTYHDTGLVEVPTLDSVCHDIRSRKRIKKSLALTPGQYKLIQPLLQGKTSKQIARELKLSPRTVEFYIQRLRAQYNARNKTELIHMLSDYA